MVKSRIAKVVSYRRYGGSIRAMHLHLSSAIVAWWLRPLFQHTCGATYVSKRDLKDVYADELEDLWSANDQMTKVVQVMAGKAHDPKLKAALEKSVSGINKHANTIKTLLSDADEEVKKEHCRGMEGLVKEATKHVTEEAPVDGQLLDVVIIAQYQRMSHYGLAGFGTQLLTRRRWA